MLPAARRSGGCGEGDGEGGEGVHGHAPRVGGQEAGTASLEQLCPCGHVYLLRVRAEGGHLLDPYGWCVVVVREDDGWAFLKGAKGGINPADGRAMKEALKAAGFKGWRWVGLDGKPHELRFR